MPETKSLPSGFTAKSASMDDVPELVDLFNRISKQIFGVEDYSIEELNYDFQTPGFDLEKDSLVVRNPAGEIIGYQDVFATAPIPVRPDLWGGVDPDYLSLGIGTYMLGWAIERARHVLAKIPPDMRVIARAWTLAEWQPGNELLKSLHFSYRRHYFEMRIDMKAPPREPEWPSGIEIHKIRILDEVEDWYRAYDDSFSDHFGYTQQPFEQAFEQFKHKNLNHPAYDPELWWAAMAENQMAGILLGHKFSEDDPHSGFIHLLGVRRPWRNRGLGLALLRHAFTIYWQRGLKTVKLSVDSDNLSGAVRLYEKAGLRVVRKISTYELELRPGRELSNQP